MTTRYYGHKSFFQGRSKGVARAKEGSRHTLGIPNEYGKSKPRVWLEYGWSMARVWLEANILFPRWEQNIPTLGTKHSHVGNKTGLRFVVILLLMLVVGVDTVWGQTTYTFYVINNSGRQSVKSTASVESTSTVLDAFKTTASVLSPLIVSDADYYFYDTEADAIAATGFTSGGGNGLSTVATIDSNNDNTIYVRYFFDASSCSIDLTGTVYYNIKVGGRYLAFNNNRGNRPATVNIEDSDPALKSLGLTSNLNYIWTLTGGDPYNITITNVYKTGGVLWEPWDASQAYNMWVKPIEGTIDSDNTYKNTISGKPYSTVCSFIWSSNKSGSLMAAATTSFIQPNNSGYYAYLTSSTQADLSKNNPLLKQVANAAAEAVTLTPLKCATPTITYDNSTGDVTIETATEGAAIYYTTDGSTTPTSSSTLYSAPFSIANTTTIQAIAIKSGFNDSEVITQTIVVNPVIDPIASVTYNGSEQEPAVTVKDGETPIDEDEYEVTYTNNKNVGTATITITGKDGGNYILSGSTTFTITKAPVTVTADAKSKGYGDADPTLTFTATGLLGSDTEANAFTGALSRESGEAKGTYAITQGTLTSTNYEISFTGAYLTITNKTLTITAGSDSKVYDGTALTNNTYTNTSLLAGDAIESVTVSGSQTNAGSSANVPSGAVIKNGSNENVTANYEITYVNGTLTVTPRPVTITADSDTKEYDGTALTKNTYTNTALLEGHSLTSVTVTGSQTVAGSSANVPSAAVIMNGETDVTENYAPKYVNGTLEVTQKALTITADDATKVYDGTPLTKSTYTNTVLATGDAIESVTFTGSQTDVGNSSNVPSAAVIKNGSNETVTASYAITYTNGTLAVTPASVTVTADDASKTYGDTDPTLTATVTGLVNNEPESLITITSVSRTEGENAGNYTITPAGDATQGNYAVSYVTGTFTIIPKVLGDGTRAAEGMIITMTDNGSGGYTVTVKDGATTLTEDTHYTLTTEDDVVTITGIGNYSGSARLVYANAAFATPDAEHVPSKDGYAAVYVSAMDVLAPSSVTVYVVKKVNATIGTVTVTEIGYIPEGVPVLLVADNNQTGFAASPVDFNETTPISDAVRNSNKLQIAPASGVTVAAKEAYVLYKGEFVLTLAGTISAGKIFLYNPNYTPAGGGAGVKILRFVVEDEDPDGINEELRIKNEEYDDGIYDLSGRKINSQFSILNSQFKKGIYITNGRKVYVK